MVIKGIPKRVLSVFLSLVMTVGLVSSVFATDDTVEEETSVDTIGTVESTDEAKATEPIIVEDETNDFDIFGDYEDELSEYQYVSSVEQYGSAENAYMALKGNNNESDIETYAVQPLATVGNVYAYWDNSSHTLTFTNGTSSASGDKYDLTNYNGDEANLPWRGTYPNYNEHYSDISSITSIVIADDIYPGNIYEWFYGFENATFSGLSKLHTDYCTNISRIFSYCNLTQANCSDIASWNTSNVVDASWAFSTNKNMQSINLSSWDLSNAENIAGLFDGCSSLTTITLPNSSSRAPHAKYMYFTFSGCTNLTTINNLNLVNTSNTTDMEGIFLSDENLSGTFDLSSWDFSNVQDFSEAFYDCQRITSIKFPSSSSRSMHSLISSGSAFYECYSLESVENIGLWDITTVDDSDTSMLGGINHLFDDCRSLKSIDLSAWDFSNLHRLDMMFYRCFSLESAKFPTNTATGPRESTDTYVAILGGFYAMFYDCYSLKELDLSGFTFVNDVYSSVGRADFLYGCSSLEKVIFGSGLTVGMALPWAYDVNGWNECWYNSNGTRYTADNSYIGYVIPSGVGIYYSYDRNHTHNWTGEFWWPYFDDPEANEWWGYAEDYCTVHLTCSGCLTEDYGYCDVARTTLSADCTDYGEIIYTAMYTSSLGGNSVSTVRTIITADPLGHNWEFVSSSFNSNYTSGSISIRCTRCGATHTINNCSVTTTAHKDATCTDGGYTEHQISGSYDGKTFTDKTTTYSSAKGHSYDLTSYDVTQSFAVVSDDADGMRQAIVSYAKTLVDEPYVKGGRGNSMWDNSENTTGHWPVFDCSGLTQYVYLYALEKDYSLSVALQEKEAHQLSSPGWDVASQWNFAYGYHIDKGSNWSDFLNRLEPGDLVFMNIDYDNGGAPGHVGIYIGNGQMIDANSTKEKVVIEDLQSERDFNDIMGARRYIAGIGETYDIGTMSFTCSVCGDVQTYNNCSAYIYDGVTPLGNKKGSISYTVSLQPDFNSRIYLEPVGQDLPQTCCDWDYSNAYMSINDDGTVNVYGIVCKLCGAPLTVYYIQPKYVLTYEDFEDGSHVYGITKLSIMYDAMDENGVEYSLEQEITDTTEIEQIDSLHDWVPLGSSIDPTCTTNGYAEYICEDCGSTKIVNSQAHGHEWMSEFEWSDDFEECIVHFTCVNCGETEDIEAFITSESDGDDIIYTATATFNDRDYQEIMIVNAGKNENTGEQGITTPTDNNNNNNGTNNVSNVNTKSDTNESSTVEIDHFDNVAREAENTSSADAADTDTAQNTSDGTDTQSTISVNNGTSDVSSGISTSTNSNSDSSGGKGTSSTDDPKTGDNFPVWIGIAGISALSGIGIVTATKKKKCSD